MKNLLIFCCIFLFIGSLSAEDCGYFVMNPEGGWTYVPRDCPPDGDPCFYIDCSDDEGGGGSDGTGPVTCQTNTSIISQTTYPCGNGGFVTEIVYAMSCTPGTQGSCEDGTATELIVSGCEDVDLPGDYIANLTTTECG